MGFVPTMGALHQGHLSLVDRSLKENEITLVSIFVNPTQFGPSEEFKKYPRSLDSDLEMLKPYASTMVFAPPVNQIYPRPLTETTGVCVPKLSNLLCGRTRPGHFDGVCTVVLRLFNMIRPDRVYFGEKDFQQFTILKRMAEDLFLPIDIVACPIVRELDGLAMSSRNRFLSPENRRQAAMIYRSLSLAQKLYRSGDRDPSVITSSCKLFLTENSSIKIDYLTIVDSVTLEEKINVDASDRIVFAGFLGSTRLIDNLQIG